MDYDVLVVGRPSFDLIFTGVSSWPVVGQEVFARNLTTSAGGTFNVVAALHRLGVGVGMVGSVGNDVWSRQAFAAMEAEGVCTTLMQVLDHPLPALSICVSHEGDRGFLTHEHVDPEVGTHCAAHVLEVLHRESAQYVQACLNPDLAAFAHLARDRGMRVIVDCGWDEPWLTSRQIRTLMPLADIVFANEPEACAIAGEADPRAAVRRLGEIVPFVVVKRGAAGASAVVEGREFHAPTEPVEVVDATGAGDCFNAGFLYGLLRGRSIADSLHIGNVCGGMSVAVPGGHAGAPTEADLLARLRPMGATPRSSPL
ncbi:MAG: carbohydrate kinase family protein [Thermomicrobiales bacterium]